MYSEAQFVNDFIRAYPTYARKDRSAGAINLCYKTYLNSSRAQLGSLVVGRIEKPATSAGEPAVIGLGDIERINFGITNNRDSGSALWSKYWSIPLNDSWLMGGIHHQLPFYMASTRTMANLENRAEPQHVITVTARELIGLATFGYKRNPNTRMGEVFECEDYAKARSATFFKYAAAVEAAKASGDWKKLLAK